jgi:uncharacterized protein (DUF924 family)
VTAQDVLDFWFSESMSGHWFQSTPEIDQAIRDQFEETWLKAAAGELDDWMDSASGCLAMVIILDQFPLNMYRQDGRRYATEQKAVQITRYAIERGFDKELPQAQRAFLFMPLMHSEDIADQNLSLEVFAIPGLEESLKFARHHHLIVERFGRFPHRNEHLGRESTPEEIKWLSSDEGYSA